MCIDQITCTQTSYPNHSIHTMGIARIIGMIVNGDISCYVAVMSGSAHELPVVPAETARKLLLGGQGLLNDPARKVTPAIVYQQIEKMGYVQMDTINIITRAHHHILHSRFDDYRPRMLTKLLEKDRKLFEHWTHDASVIPTIWYPCWKCRFELFRREFACKWIKHPWWKERIGKNYKKLFAHVKERIERDGPMMSKDFEHKDDKNDRSWWGWKPQKAALDVLWRMGELAVRKRINFHKVYDLAERVFPDLHSLPTHTQSEYIDWSCKAALDRLVVATPNELAAYFGGVSLQEARTWGTKAIKCGEACEVSIESADGSAPKRGLALLDWKKRAARLTDAPQRIRLLSPFDPVIRDRKRLLRYFNFDYRFEGFVPAAKRQYGYYVLPILEGDRFVGRLDPKLHRDRSELEIKGLWWEPKIKPTKKRQALLDDALHNLAEFVGATKIMMKVSASR